MASSSAEILREHYALEGGSPSITYIESFYLNKPGYFTPRKIREIGSLSTEQQEHSIRHIQAVMLMRRQRRRVPPRTTFRSFYSTPSNPGYITRRFRFARDALGRPHKYEKTTGRYAHYNQEERKIADQQHKKIRQAQPMKPQGGQPDL